MKIDLASATDMLMAGQPLCDDQLLLQLDGCSLRLRSNSAALVEKLRGYFAHVVVDEASPDLEVVAIEQAPPDLGIEFVDWKREPGKSGRKDSYYDLEGARLVRKVRTGMVFLQRAGTCIAAGPCLEYDNQVINFINAQYMNWLQNRGWLICHAAGLVTDRGAFGIAGFSGGGKSTLMLHLMEHDEVAYLTNDRLFIKREGEVTNAVGIPKLPRVNPGTIVHNPRLHSLISAEERERLLGLPQEELWHLEDKYDVLMEPVYGAGRIITSAPLSGFLILNWQRDADEEITLSRIDIRERRELLQALMKSPGPFYQYPDGRFFEDTTELDEAPYLDVLSGVEIYEASGRIDFGQMAGLCLSEIME